jgi:hypothetical protein
MFRIEEYVLYVSFEMDGEIAGSVSVPKALAEHVWVHEGVYEQPYFVHFTDDEVTHSGVDEAADLCAQAHAIDVLNDYRHEAFTAHHARRDAS